MADIVITEICKTCGGDGTMIKWTGQSVEDPGENPASVTCVVCGGAGRVEVEHGSAEVLDDILDKLNVTMLLYMARPMVGRCRV